MSNNSFLTSSWWPSADVVLSPIRISQSKQTCLNIRLQSMFLSGDTFSFIPFFRKSVKDFVFHWSSLEVSSVKRTSNFGMKWTKKFFTLMIPNRFPVNHINAEIKTRSKHKRLSTMMWKTYRCNSVVLHQREYTPFPGFLGYFLSETVQGWIGPDQGSTLDRVEWSTWEWRFVSLFRFLGLYRRCDNPSRNTGRWTARWAIIS